MGLMQLPRSIGKERSSKAQPAVLSTSELSELGFAGFLAGGPALFHEARELGARLCAYMSAGALLWSSGSFGPTATLGNLIADDFQRPDGFVDAFAFGLEVLED